MLAGDDGGRSIQEPLLKVFQRSCTIGQLSERSAGIPRVKTVMEPAPQSRWSLTFVKRGRSHDPPGFYDGFVLWHLLSQRSNRKTNAVFVKQTKTFQKYALSFSETTAKVGTLQDAAIVYAALCCQVSEVYAT